MTLAIGWFTTARGPGSRGMFEAVLHAIDDGNLDARFAFVFSNREPGEDAATDACFDLVRSRGIPLVTLSSVGYRRTSGGPRSRPGEPLPAWREGYDAEVARLIEGHHFDIGALAGYMLIFTPDFVRRFPLLNLHPALPGGPKGTWREVIRALIRSRGEESGVMAHLAIPEVDEGPVAAFCRYAVRGGAFDALWADVEPRIDALDDADIEATPLFAAIRERQLAAEAPFLAAVLDAFARGRLRASGGRVLDASGATAAPLDLTDEVTARMRSEARA
ncbi:MAG: phosphoglycerate transporter [Dehalococcoidia bacterium]|nr:phosphoglycerate transporter [Dehalococcoidia bacterium]